jgi:hypothetical protein
MLFSDKIKRWVQSIKRNTSNESSFCLPVNMFVTVDIREDIEEETEQYLPSSYYDRQPEVCIMIYD